MEVVPLEKVYAIDQDPGIVQDFVKNMSRQLGISVLPGQLEEAIQNSDICVTCTPSRSPFLKNEYLTKGTFLAAVGADSPEKQELEPEI